MDTHMDSIKVLASGLTQSRSPRRKGGTLSKSIFTASQLVMPPANAKSANELKYLKECLAKTPERSNQKKKGKRFL